MAMNFNDVLNTKVEDAERPPLLPVGTYEWVISRVPTMETSNSGDWDIVGFPLKCVRATDDVDIEALRTFGNPTGQYQNHNFLFNKNDAKEFDQSKFRLRRFLEEHVGIEKGLNFKEGLNAAVNKKILGSIVWKQDKTDPEVFHANIGRTAPLS